MTKTCDHTSVGIIVKKDDKILLIERKNFPFGFAPPAGHVDDDPSFEIAARRELEEEVGLSAITLTLLIEGRKENPCRREDGSWHFWKIYKADVVGDLEGSKEETKSAKFYSIHSVRSLQQRTEDYLSGQINDEDWANSPGIEPIWSDWLKEIGELV